MRLSRLLVLSATLALSACAGLAPPRPLAPGEVYWCCPGSAVPRRVAFDHVEGLPGVRTGLHRSTRCGAF